MDPNKSPYAVFDTDKELEKSGVWIDYGNFKFLIARAGGSNEKYKRLMNHRMKPFRRLIQTDTMSEEKAQDILLETFLDAVLLDWENVTDKEGQPMEFNRDNARKLFTDLRDLFNDLQQQAQKISIFRREEMETDLGE